MCPTLEANDSHNLYLLGTIYLLSATIATIGAGVMTTWDPDTSLAKLFGCQILYMFGVGLSQNIYYRDSMEPMTPRNQFIANLAICQSGELGTALTLSIVQNILNNRLKNLLYAPTSDKIFQLSHFGVSSFMNGTSAESLNDLESRVRSISSSSMISSLFFLVAVNALSIIPALGIILSGLRENRRKRR